MRSIGNDAPQPVEVFYDLAGQRYARLTKNVEEDWRDAPDDPEAESQRFYTWDELTFKTSLTEEELEGGFESIWYEVERRQMPDDEWRKDVDSSMLDLMELVVG